MTPEEIATAEAMLAKRPELRSFIESRSPWLNATDVGGYIGIAASTVRKLCERSEMPGAIYYGPDIGWRIPRSGLIEYLARAIMGDGRQSASGAR